METSKGTVIHIPRRFTRSEWGGTETTILRLCKAMDQRDFEHKIFTSKALDSQSEESLEGVKIKRFDYFYPYLSMDEQTQKNMDKKGGNLFSFGLFWALLTEPNLRLIHLHTGKRMGGIARLVARIRKVPYVVTLHGGVFDVPASEQQGLSESRSKAGFEWGKILGAIVGARRVLEDAAAIFCVGAKEAELAKKALPGKRVELLPNGVDSEAFKKGDGNRFRKEHSIPSDAKVIACISRIDYQKNQLQLIESINKLVGSDPRVHLLLIGPVTVDSYQNELTTLLEKYELNSNVTQLPGISYGDSSLFDAFHSADIFCLPSKHEPFGIVILEAWASGLPVVVANVGGIPSFTEEGVDSLRFDPESPDELTAALLKLLTDDELSRSISTSGFNKARSEYDWTVIAKKLGKLYREIIEAA